MPDRCCHGHEGAMRRETHDGKLRCQTCRRDSNRRRRAAKSSEYGEPGDFPVLVLGVVRHLLLDL